MDVGHRHGDGPTGALRLEVVCVPVSDVDRARKFYVQAGFTLDVDYRPDDDFRVVQLTPPGSATSIQLRHDPPRAGSLRDTLLVVHDLAATTAALGGRGVDVSPARHKATSDGEWHGGFAPGVDPGHGDYASFADFHDPDGNGWLLQERSFGSEGTHR